jgi:hypothetical protein
MTRKTLWASLSGAAEHINVSPDTILRRAEEFPGKAENIHLQACPAGRV